MAATNALDEEEGSRKVGTKRHRPHRLLGSEAEGVGERAGRQRGHAPWFALAKLLGNYLSAGGASASAIEVSLSRAVPKLTGSH
jgi:hypothetical protein